MHCKELCKGIKPCFNTCCKPGEAYDDTTACRPMSENLTDFFLREHAAFHDFRGIAMDNFAKAPSFALACPPGYHKSHRLKPDVRCDDAFWFTQDEEGGGVIQMDSEQVEGPQNNFCIGFHQNRTLSVEACTRIEGYNKFKFYPYILLLSAFFLLLTVIVYTAYPKGGVSEGRGQIIYKHLKCHYFGQ